MEEGNDKIELPSCCNNTLIPCFWKDKEIDGKTYSIIHPDIKAMIVCIFAVIIIRWIEFQKESYPGNTYCRTM